MIKDDGSEEGTRNNLESVQVFGHIYNPQLDECLRPMYRGHKKEFWAALQAFHDTNHNWEGNVLTTGGRAIADGIIAKHG
jgi:hypothetical protein